MNIYIPVNIKYKKHQLMIFGIGAVTLTGLLLLADILKAKKIVREKERKKREIVKLCITGGP